MSFAKAQQFLSEKGFADRIIVPSTSTATVELAAEALGTVPAAIAKTLSFMSGDGALLVLAEGTARIDNHKFKETFHMKATMVPWDRVEALVGHAPGGVCPFGINEGVRVYLDESLKKHPLVYPAAGDDRSGVKLTVNELETVLDQYAWVDVCKDGAPA